jgi:hypothetical protein
MIDSYRFGNIVIDGEGYSSDVLILPSGVKTWWRRQGHELSPEDLDDVLAGNSEVLVIGTGAYGMVHIPSEVEEFLKSRGLEIVVEATDKACDSYNRLCRSGKVAAALHLTC